MDSQASIPLSSTPSSSSFSSLSSTRKRPYPEEETEVVDVNNTSDAFEHFEGPFDEFPLRPVAAMIDSPLHVLTPQQEFLLDERDVFSKSPDDVIFKIFSYMSRKTIDTMKSVSQKMNFFANHSTADKVKIRASEIQIVQNHEGHAFHVRSANADEESCVLFVKCTDLITEPSSSTVDDPNTLPETRCRFYCRPFKYIGYHHKSLADFVQYNAVHPRNHETPVPRILFTKLKWLLEKYNSRIATLKLVNVLIDKSLIYHLKQSFKNRVRVSLVIDGAVLDPTMTNDDCREFGNWMLGLIPRSVYMENALLEGNGLINERFIRRISSAVDSTGYNLTVKSDRAVADRARFHACRSLSRSALPHFHTIFLHSLTIDIGWLVESFNNRMSVSYSTGDWRFCVTGAFNSVIHCSRENLGPHMDYKLDESAEYHVLCRKDNNNFVGFAVNAYQPGVYVMEARFLNNGSRKFPDKPYFSYDFEQRNRR
ncbi:hypothetical protein PENTCL1PPCAC_28847 [Pristionchus entomophagus]|uniref:F-box domain-containing protein n=1 Tax=Pristionchus entomophagus TaxID=358040 RepID=A0AAV5UK18_9BILA|nr:hypothetical protein PENTCL1PPCAC_28847 [Pristionchus entomophagus]